MLVLGLETSCDETAAGIVDGDGHILANRVASQFEEHKPYGGVVPEIAARAHLDRLDDLIKASLKDAGTSFAKLDGIAATSGPGLIGGVIVGALTAKAIAAVRSLPFIAVNHLEAHALTARMTDKIAFPYLLLLVSGGHSQLLLVCNVGQYKLLGTTIDDAVGECFDKGAKLLGLGYPGGPAVERAAANGNAKAFNLPRPLLGRKGCDFSFSGLKTALRQLVEEQKTPAKLPQKFVADAAASLQAAIADILADRTQNAFRLICKEKITALVVAGGVAANQALRTRLEKLAKENQTRFVAPPVALCTDNGAMVAWAGLERLRLGLTDQLDAPARPRWPLEELAAKVN